MYCTHFYCVMSLCYLVDGSSLSSVIWKFRRVRARPGALLKVPNTGLTISKPERLATPPAMHYTGPFLAAGVAGVPSYPVYLWESAAFLHELTFEFWWETGPLQPHLWIEWVCCEQMSRLPPKFWRFFFLFACACRSVFLSLFAYRQVNEPLTLTFFF